jgi:signal transduction histidine kinase
MVDVERSILDALGAALDAPVTTLAASPDDIRRAVRASSNRVADGLVHVRVDNRDYLCNREHEPASTALVLGPLRCVEAGSPDSAALDPAVISRVSSVLRFGGEALNRATELSLQRLELAGHLEVVGRSVLAVTSELELDLVLRRIVDLARELAKARYAALGVPDGRGELAEFLTSGMTDEQERRIGPLPRGRGLLGLLLREPKTIRLADLSAHAASVGFPEKHPPMKSFLGVPIISRGRVVGNLYLTEKVGEPEFSETDARLIEILARHAGVAIENARLYSDLQEQQEQLRVILDQLPEAVLFLESAPNRVTMMNREARKMIGGDVEFPIPLETFAEMLVLKDQRGNPIPLEQRPMFRSLVAGEVITRQEATYESSVVTGRTQLINSVPIFSEGTIVASLVVFQDITAIKEIDQLKDDFLSLVSHELRTPLTTIHAGTQLLLAPPGTIEESDRDDILRDMHNESSRLATVIQNMMQLAQVQAGRLEHQIEPVLVSQVVRTAVGRFNSAAQDREIRVDVEPDLVVMADPESIDGILRNLIQNAIKYTPSGTPIDVCACAVGELVEFTVRDYGAGIPIEDIDSIFERFQRGAQGRSGRSPGMGLGLYLVRLLVEAQGGTVGVERPDDGGTRFRLDFPRARAE